MQINQLIIVAGSSGAGKSRLIAQLRGGDHPQLNEQLNISRPAAWSYLLARQLGRRRQPKIERLIIHYDLYTQFCHTKGFRRIAELIESASSVTVLTVYAPPQTLVQRNNSRLLQTFKSMIACGFRQRQAAGQISRQIHLHKLLRLFRRRQAYKRGFSRMLYRKWFDFCLQKSIENHWIVDSSQVHAAGTCARLTPHYNAAGYPQNLALLSR